VSAGFDDLNPAHVAIFRYPTADGMRPSDLAEDMQITKQSVNELLGHLERRGYVVREIDETDSRSRRIRLTERGRKLENVTWAAAERAEGQAAELIGAERVRELRRTLTDLVAVLGIGGGPASP
jgi:DNA-binding MarR family transcriptional regulator